MKSFNYSNDLLKKITGNNMNENKKQIMDMQVDYNFINPVLN